MMKETEEWAKLQGFNSFYLTSADSVDFYQKLGYNFCPPIQYADYRGLNGITRSFPNVSFFVTTGFSKKFCVSKTVERKYKTLDV